ncbi:MAG TPA: hypothetical protein VGX25_06820 [Actinophytocola sp.]|uniref:hypothetical protein n=1 Tax=Actinophytocola sp. TaxID=1872138 RepID=UPI002DDD9CCF|nr:hypothetical protein [Actinophytocola sp.]HEV2779101.1 hypothetical protein [Actinophytocola sp.]
MSLPEIPPLEPRLPLCSVCGEETSGGDDGAVECRGCGITWPEHYWLENGQWDDPDADRCSATVQPWADNRWVTDAMRALVFQCVLAASHANARDELRWHAHPEVTGKVAVRGWR